MTRIARYLLLTILIVVVANSISAQTCTRHTELQGGFSLCIPDGWVVREKKPDAKYRSLFGPMSNGFAPNINFRDEMSDLKLSAYVAEGIKLVLASTQKIGATSIEPLGQSDFITDSGIRGIRAIFQTLYKGILVRTTQYYFPAGSNRKIIVTCTGLDNNKEVFDRVFDRTVKSFRLER